MKYFDCALNLPEEEQINLPNCGIKIDKHNLSIGYYGIYYETYKRNNWNISEADRDHTDMVLDVKKFDRDAIKKFTGIIIPEIEKIRQSKSADEKKVCLLRAPSSEKDGVNGVERLIESICKERAYINGSQILQRKYSVGPRHLKGGKRSPDEQFKSIDVNIDKLNSVSECNWLIVLDDVAVSGQTIAVCCYYLNKLGINSKKIIAWSLGRNYSDPRYS